MTLLLLSALQTAVILLIAVAVLPLLRRRSAAFRHCVLASGLIFSAATPAFNLLMPSWSVPESLAKAIPGPQAARLWQDSPRAVAPSTPDTQLALPDVPKRAISVTPRQLTIGVWVTGASAGMVVLIIGLFRLARIASRSRPVETWTELSEHISNEYKLPRPVQLLQSENPSILVTWGVTRPKVILPRGASTWTADVAAIVLRHELAHVRRRDWLVQMLAQSLRIIYWFNPLIWVVCRRLRLEAELACDDAVIVRDISGHEYAGHLLGLARSLNTTDRAWSAVLTMARPSTLERRFTAMLNPELNRKPLTRSAVLVTLLVGLCITASLPVLKTFAAAAPPPASSVQARVQPVNPSPATAPAPVPQAQAPRVTPPQGLPNNEAELHKSMERWLTEASKIQEIPPGTTEKGAWFGGVFPFAFPGQGQLPSAESVEMLIKLFDESKDAEMKRHILGYLGMSNNPKAAEKVLAIARSTADKELQQEAISYIGLRPNAFDELVSLFDSSRDPEIKRVILDNLGMSKDPRVTQKLFSVAQSDADPEIRRMAVDYIAFR